MHSIHSVRQNLVETSPLHRESITIQEQSMVRVNLANLWLETIVECW
jgi:hypothetical protein